MDCVLFEAEYEVLNWRISEINATFERIKPNSNANSTTIPMKTNQT